MGRLAQSASSNAARSSAWSDSRSAISSRRRSSNSNSLAVRAAATGRTRSPAWRAVIGGGPLRGAGAALVNNGSMLGCACATGPATTGAAGACIGAALESDGSTPYSNRYTSELANFSLCGLAP